MAQRSNPHYQVTQSETPSVPGTASGTQEELAHMQSGERWSLTATERSYNAGGVEPGPMTVGSPQQERQ